MKISTFCSFTQPCDDLTAYYNILLTKYFEIKVKGQYQHQSIGPEPVISGLEKIAPHGELEFFSRSIQKNIDNFLLFLQFDLDENSSSPERTIFSRPDIPGSGANIGP